MAQPNHEDNIVLFSAKPTVTIVMVTPDMAARWLETNTVNRNMRQFKVNQYARDMRNGNWKLTGEPVKFSSTGRLLDGQHRLWGIVEAGVAVALFVARGLQDDTQEFMDTGVARTASDNLSMRGEIHATAFAAAARIGSIVDRNLLFTDRKTWVTSHSDIYQWIADNPDIRASLRYVTVGDARKAALRDSIKIYAHYRFARVDRDAADEFFTSLGSMVNIPQGSPIQALSSRLYRIGVTRTRVEMPNELSMLFRAWNAWRAGRSMSVIPVSMKTRELPELI